MNISTYTGRVETLNTELAGLREKLVAQRQHQADADARARAAREAVQAAKDAAQIRSGNRDVDRFQRRAVLHERRSAALEKLIAKVEAGLNKAQERLVSARREQTARERQEEAERLRRLETASRLEAAPARTSSVSPTAPSARREFSDIYDVCLSFAGEQRGYVEGVAAGLKAAGLRVFYDQDEDIAPDLWGRDLGEYLDYIYRQASRFCVMFISSAYAEKAWAVHERRSALARAIEAGGDYILPARFDTTELPGIRPTIGYVDLASTSPKTLVKLVREKLNRA